MNVTKDRLSRWAMYLACFGLLGSFFYGGLARYPVATGFYVLMFLQYPALQLWQGYQSDSPASTTARE